MDYFLELLLDFVLVLAAALALVFALAGAVAVDSVAVPAGGVAGGAAIERDAGGFAGAVGRGVRGEGRMGAAAPEGAEAVRSKESNVDSVQARLDMAKGVTNKPHGLWWFQAKPGETASAIAASADFDLAQQLIDKASARRQP